MNVFNIQNFLNQSINKKIMTKIKRISKNFDLLEKKDQKILIAKDVINSLKTGFYEAEKGEYVNIDSDLACTSKDIKTNLKEINSCKACAIGSVLISVTKYKNQLTFSDIEDDWYYDTNYRKSSFKKVKSLFSEYFSPKELALMEYCFEGDTNNYSKNVFKIELSDKEQIICENFYDNNYDDDERLIAIMNVIIKKGEFTL